MYPVILHRAKDLNSGEWLYGYIDLLNGAYTMHKIGEYYTRFPDESTISSHTGLLDNSEPRNPIWYGDIVEGKTVDAEGRVLDSFVGLVVPDKYGPGIRSAKGSAIRHDFERLRLRVIGNEWDNPELLE